ncbi:MAG TPA: Gmad2 immunoglobulin-like domain-containing protein [Gaiellaceae bacterium]|nr:Gmad2 immunoglobulin-like domain-containing protein [Gaiellaceae bacterium]
MRRVLVPSCAAGLFALAGCGGGGNATETTTVTTTVTTTTTAPAAKTALRVYFLRGGQVWPVAREVEKTQAVGRGALDALLAGPTKQERTDLKLTTAIPDGTQVKSLAISGGVATLELSTALSAEPLSQVVYTLTQFPTVKAVEIDGKRYTRADFEAQTPPILVESPLSGETVSSPIRVTGTANTFEATFQYELRDAVGKILSKHFEMATSGSGTRGTFDFTVPFTVDHAQPGRLVLYEDSAENGSQIHVQEIPLELSP